jgi:branched-chain amino acid transport system substrate-binding protein
LIATEWATRILVLGALAAAATALPGCGTNAVAHNRISGRRLTVYLSVPLNGASSVSGRAVLRGAQLALDGTHARIGRYRIGLRALDDSTVQSDGWNPGQTALNVHRAIQDGSTIGYIGEFNSGASAVAIPILNRAGIPQISPSSTAVGLTQGGSEAAPGEPQKYYPTGVRTFARVVPSDTVQATVQVALQRSSGCTRTYVLQDGEVDGSDAADSFEVAAKATGLRVVAMQQFQPKAASYVAVARAVAQSGADCVLISALTESGAALLTRQVAAAVPRARLFGSASLAETTFTNPALGGIPEAIDQRMLITVATLDPDAYPPAGRRFFALYRRHYGSPQPYAIYGYAAMSLMLESISEATDHGAEPAVRSRVLTAIFAGRERSSVLGPYSIDRQGDTSLDRYGVWRLRDGELSFWKALSG